MTLTNSRRLKIALVAPFGLKTKGTTAARLLPIAEVMAGRGHQVRVIIPPWDDPITSADLQLKKPRYEHKNGVELVFVPVQPGPQPLTIPARLYQQIFRNFQPDIIHVFKPKAYSGLTGLLLALRQHRFVLDTDDWEGSGGYNDVNPYSPLQKRLFSWQEQDLPRRASAVSVASQTLQTQVWGFGVPPGKVVYLPNGISLFKYAGWNNPALTTQTHQWRQKFGFTPDDIVLLAYTRFAEFNSKRLLEIFQLILKQLPPELVEKTRLLVVGAGFSGEEETFKQQAANYGLGQYIQLSGMVDLADLAAVLRCGDVALYPFDDNLINRARCSAKFLDLLMAERPTVTEAVGELPHYLLSGEGGFVVPPGDHKAFAEAVCRLILLSPQERASFGQTSAKRLQAYYTWERLSAPLEQLYFKLNKIN